MENKLTAHKPNFFIVGAPKCGTTAMSEYLRTHPNVHMSPHKEPMFFSSDIMPRRHSGIDDYLSLFNTRDKNKTIFSEASTTYLYSNIAIKRIHELFPQSKIMAMLRNPVDLLYSLHGEFLNLGHETEWDFEAAWHLQDERREGKNVPFHARHNSAFLQYKAYGSIGSQIRALNEIFPQSQIHTIIFDDFVLDPGAEYRRLLDFLNVPDDGREDFPRINESKQFKSTAIAGWSRKVRARALPLAENIKNHIGVERLGIINFVDRFNRQTRPRPPLRPEFRKYLIETFEPEVHLLETLLCRDLSAWKNTSNSAATFAAAKSR